MAYTAQTPATTFHTQQERELKWAIPADQGNAIERAFIQRWGPGQRLAQHNRFYDSPDGILRAKRMSLRLRRENETIVLTCKQRKSVSKSLHHQQEEECQVNALIWATMQNAETVDPQCLPLPAPLRATLGQTSLKNMGGFFNRRHQWQVDGDTLCLDYSEFRPSYSEWEIEVEVGDNTHGNEREAFWRDCFAAMGIALLPQPRSKLQRFIEGPM